MSAPAHPALRFYLARDLAEIIDAQREMAGFPAVSHPAAWDHRAGSPQPGGPRDPALFPDPEESGAVVDLPVPVAHPLVLRELAAALEVDVSWLRSVGSVEVFEDETLAAHGVDEPGPEALLKLAERAFAGRGLAVEALFTRRIPLLPIAQRPVSGAHAPSPLDHQITWAIRSAAQARSLMRLNAPSMLVGGAWRALQGTLENLVLLIGGEGEGEGRETVSPRWIDTDPRHLASFLRMDRGEGRSDDDLWAWASAPRAPEASSQIRCYRSHPWAPDKAFVLGLALLDRALVVVHRHGFAVCDIEGRGRRWIPVGPMRPFAHDGRHLAALDVHPRGDYVPSFAVLDTETGDLVDRYPETLPRHILAGHWGAKSLVIFDRERRRERLLRPDQGDDYGHHFSSADGAHAWLADAPEEGILRVSDGTPVFDLGAIGLGAARGLFPRAFVRCPSGAFRVFARGRMHQDGALRWEEGRGVPAAFSATGDLLATVHGKRVKIRRLDEAGQVTSTSSFPLPYLPEDFRLPKSLEDEVLADILFAVAGPLDQVAEIPGDELESRLTREVEIWSEAGIAPGLPPDQIGLFWARDVQEHARAVKKGASASPLVQGRR